MVVRGLSTLINLFYLSLHPSIKYFYFYLRDRSFIVKPYDLWRIILYYLSLLKPAISLEFFILYSATIRCPPATPEGI
jgi:hypothetical protein